MQGVNLYYAHAFTLGGPLIFAVAALLWLIAFDDGQPRSRLTWAAVRASPKRLVECLAVLTYGVFLWHAPVLIRLAGAFRHQSPVETYLLMLGIGLPCSLLLAALTYFAIERPALRFSARMKPGKEPMKVPALPAS